jgi:Flp pilus assembly secretin CpaC
MSAVARKLPRIWFSLGHLLALTLGVAIGFLPLKLWELSAPAKPHIVLHVKVLEILPADLSRLGIAGQSAAGSVIGMAPSDIDTRIDSLHRDGKLKVLSEPSLTTLSGRPTSFNVGGEFPFPTVDESGSVTMEWKEFGTHIDFVPTLQRIGRIHLAVAVELSEHFESNEAVEKSEDDLSTPHFRTRSVRSETEINSGETMILSVAAVPRHGEEAEPVRELVCIATVERLKRR